MQDAMGPFDMFSAIRRVFRRENQPVASPEGAVVPVEEIGEKDDQRRAAMMVRRKFEHAREAKVPLLELWITCLAFYIGEQWREWKQHQRRLVQENRIPPWRVRLVDNLIQGMAETASVKLLRSRQVPKAQPKTGDPDDKAAAEAGSRVLQSLWERGMAFREFEANLNRVLFGCAFFHDMWNPELTATLPYQDLATGRVKTVEAQVGDVDVEVLTVFDVFPQPCEKWEDVTWCVVAKRKPVAWFRETFGVEVKADGGEGEDVFSSLLPDVITRSSGKGASASSAAPVPLTSGKNAGEPDEVEDLGEATLLVYYEKPCKSYPKGRHIMTVGDRFLFGRDELPMPHGELPITMIQFRLVPKRLWPCGLIETLIPQQKELNRLQSYLAEVARIFRGFRIFLDKSWGVDKDKLTTNPDAIIEGDFRSFHPSSHIIPTPNLPAFMVQGPEMVRQAMRELAGQHEVSQGGVPPGVVAASAIALLQRADNTRLTSPAELGRLALEKLASKLLKSVVKLYQEQRLISTFGRDKGPQFLALSGADIGERDVRVDLTEGVEDNGTVRQEQLYAYFGSPAAQLPAPLQIVLLRAADLTWIAEAFEEAQMGLQQQAQEAAQADQEEMMLQRDQEEMAQDQEMEGADADRQHQIEMAQMQQQGRMDETAIKGQQQAAFQAMRPQPAAGARK